jgi:AmiR/NasT family two-component response regulator
MAVAVAVRQSEHATLKGQLRHAIAGRAVIDQALGIVMSQQRCTATEAIAVPRKIATSNCP